MLFNIFKYDTEVHCFHKFYSIDLILGVQALNSLEIFKGNYETFL